MFDRKKFKVQLLDSPQLYNYFSVLSLVTWEKWDAMTSEASREATSVTDDGSRWSHLGT